MIESLVLIVSLYLADYGIEPVSVVWSDEIGEDFYAARLWGWTNCNNERCQIVLHECFRETHIRHARITALHEAAHVVTFNLYGEMDEHKRPWKNIMRKWGLPSRVGHTLPPAECIA